MVNKWLICRSGWREACLLDADIGDPATEGNVEVDTPYLARSVRVAEALGAGLMMGDSVVGIGAWRLERCPSP